MEGNHKVLHIFLVLSVFTNISLASEGREKITANGNTEKDDRDTLVASESKDGQIEIVKRIKEVNEDGSYTIGYEANDGSFKIESRDLLGRIRGTYGYIDENGRVRRVTYDSDNKLAATANLTKSDGEEKNDTTDATVSNKISPAVVVQRIPRKLRRNDTISNSTITANSTTTIRRPTYIFSSTVTAPTSTANTVVQSIPRKRTASVTPRSTTVEPNYQQVATYSSSTPTVLQGDHQLARPPQNDQQPQVTVKPVALPLSVSTISTNDEHDSNILRRERGEHHTNSYDIKEHVYRLRQSFGHDASDVYSAGSMTTGTPRPPLFTTTIRPGIHGLVTEQSARINSRQDNPVSTTLRPVKVYRPAQLLPAHNNVAYASQNNDDPTPSQSTATPIPAAVNREPLVAVRQPDGRNAVLIPLSHLQAGYVPILGMYPQHERQYEGSPNRQPAVVEVEQQQAVVRRLQVPVAPPLPVRVDQDGHIREATSRQPPPQYITPVAPTFITTSRYESMPVDEDVDNIRPPVSTRDLQRLLEQLIQRQSRLERIVTLTRRAPPPQPHQWEQHRFKQYRMLYPAPQFSNLHKDPATDAYQQPEYVPDLDSVRPVRRFARQKQIYPKDKENLNQQYLPSDVREMLLLKMLQLAINPALPLTDEDVQEIEEKRKGVGGARNVEILGEEDPEDDRVKIGQRFTN